MHSPPARARHRGRRAAVAAGVAAALVVGALSVAVPAAHATPPTVSIQPSSGGPGTTITVQVGFAEACTQGGTALKHTATDTFTAISFYPVTNGSASPTLVVPAAAVPGAYTVTAGCMSPIGELSATVPFTVPGVPPPEASVVISPSSGLAGTAIGVDLTFTPADACANGGAAVALRSTPSQSGTGIIDLDLFLPEPPGFAQPYHGTVTVPQGTAPGTTLYVDGGCIGPQIVSLSKQFHVLAANVKLVPWWKWFKLGLDTGAQSAAAFLTSSSPYPVSFPEITTTTTKPRAAVPTTPTTPTTQAPPPTMPSTTTTTCRRCVR